MPSRFCLKYFPWIYRPIILKLVFVLYRTTINLNTALYKGSQQQTHRSRKTGLSAMYFVRTAVITESYETSQTITQVHRVKISLRKTVGCLFEAFISGTKPVCASRYLIKMSVLRWIPKYTPCSKVQLIVWWFYYLLLFHDNHMLLFLCSCLLCRYTYGVTVLFTSGHLLCGTGTLLQQKSKIHKRTRVSIPVCKEVSNKKVIERRRQWPGFRTPSPRFLCKKELSTIFNSFVPSQGRTGLIIQIDF